jgi:hypothetical protein
LCLKITAPHDPRSFFQLDKQTILFTTYQESQQISEKRKNIKKKKTEPLDLFQANVHAAETSGKLGTVA